MNSSGITVGSQEITRIPINFLELAEAFVNLQEHPGATQDFSGPLVNSQEFPGAPHDFAKAFMSSQELPKVPGDLSETLVNYWVFPGACSRVPACPRARPRHRSIAAECRQERGFRRRWMKAPKDFRAAAQDLSDSFRGCPELPGALQDRSKLF